jgi:hypothetical protein
MRCGTCGQDKELSPTNFVKYKSGRFWTRRCKSCQYKHKNSMQVKKEPPNYIKPETIACKLCGITKPYTEDYFYKNGGMRWGLNYVCKPCEKTRQRTYQLAVKYGVDPDKTRTLLVLGSCRVCGARGTETRLVVDHCHAREYARAILCNSCNIALGLLREDEKRIRALADYVAGWHKV